MPDNKDLDKLNTFLHYMKGCEPFSVIFKSLIRTRRQWCPFKHGEGVDHDCYKSNPSVHALLNYLDKYVLCCRYLDSDKYGLDNMQEAIQELHIPEKMKGIQNFHEIINRLKYLIKYIDPDVQRKLERFTCQECKRLDEAIINFHSHCFYSNIVMAVSAVEARLIDMINKADSILYGEFFSKATMGQLIQLFDEVQYKDEKFTKLKALMPSRHMPLLHMLNQYRIFSAHPKEELITAQLAESVLHLAFAFMIDPDTCPYDQEQLSCHRGI